MMIMVIIISVGSVEKEMNSAVSQHERSIRLVMAE